MAIFHKLGEEKSVTPTLVGKKHVIVEKHAYISQHSDTSKS